MNKFIQEIPKPKVCVHCNRLIEFDPIFGYQPARHNGCMCENVISDMRSTMNLMSNLLTEYDLSHGDTFVEIKRQIDIMSEFLKSWNDSVCEITYRLNGGVSSQSKIDSIIHDV